MYFAKGLIADIVEFASLNGADKRTLSQFLNLDLNKEISIHERVSYHEMVEALSFTREMIGDNNLGLHIGEQIMLKGTQQVDEIMSNSATVEEAFNNAVKYSALISDALKSEMSQAGELTILSFEINPDWEVLDSWAVQQIIDLTLVCALKSIIWLTNKRQLPDAVHLNYPSVKKRKEYYRIFDCRVKFNEPQPAIIFRNQVLTQPVISPNKGLLAFLKKIADEEMEAIPQKPDLILQIEKIILKNLPQRTKVAPIASEMFLSSRSLQRKLLGLKTTFKQVERNILIKLAQKLITHEQRSIEEVSYLLGFSESSAFIRFFKNEMNTTPKRFQDLHQKAS